MRTSISKRFKTPRVTAAVFLSAMLFAVSIPLSGNILSTSRDSGTCQSKGDLVVRNRQPLYSRVLTNGANTSTKKIAANLRAGEYTVNYTSFDAHSEHGGQNQHKEQWYFKAFDKHGNVVATSGVTKDIPENSDYVVDGLGTINLGSNATHIQFFHNAPNSNTPESVYPTCVGFDRVTPPAVQQCKTSGSFANIQAGDHFIVGVRTVSKTYDVNLPIGTYDANYTSFDGHSDHGGQGQNNEQWHFELYSSGKLVHTSNSTADIADNTDYATGEFNQFKLTQSADKMIIKHSYPSSNTPESVYATCVGFDQVSQPSLACKNIHTAVIDRDSRKFTAQIKANDVTNLNYTFYIDGQQVASGSSNSYTAHDLSGGDHSVKVVVSSNETKSSTCDHDFSVEHPSDATLGDFVWIDINKNGVQDADERGIAGVVVTLINENGNEIATDATDSDGKYLFTGLAAGKYSVRFDQPNGYSFTNANSGDDDAADSDANPSNGVTNTVMVGVSENVRTVDAGVVPNPVVECSAINVVSASRDNISLEAEHVARNIDNLRFEWVVEFDGADSITETTYDPEFSFSPTAAGAINVSVTVVADDIRKTCESDINLDAQIDLSVKKYVGVDGEFSDADTADQAPSVIVGSEVEWKAVVTNDGPDAATGVVVTVTPGAGIEFGSVVSITDGQTIDAATGEWTVGTIAAGESFEVVIKTTVTDAGQTICWAGVTAADQTDIDSTPNDIVDGNEDDEDPALIKVTQPQVIGTPPVVVDPPVVIPSTGVASNITFVALGLAMFAFAARLGYIKRTEV